MSESDGRVTVLASDGVRPIWVAAQAPAMPGDRARLPLLDEPESAPAVALRLLRHQLRTAGDPRSIAVASPGDAATAVRCAALLALAYAELGPDPILLVEADVAHPRLAAILGLTIDDGFAAQIRDHQDGSDAPWRAASAEPPNVHVLAASPAVEAGASLPLRELSHALSELVRLPYAHVVVACPPVLGSASVNVIEAFVDGVLLTGSAGRIRAEQLQRAADQLTPARVLGAALLAGP